MQIWARNTCINIFLRQTEAEWKLRIGWEAEGRLSKVAKPMGTTSSGFFLPSQRRSPCSLWISAVLQLHTHQACSFHLGLTPAYLTSERASLNVFLPLSGPRFSPSLLRHSLSGRTVTKGKPLFPILSGVGDPNFREEKNLRIIANEAKGCINGPTRRTDFLVQL